MPTNNHFLNILRKNKLYFIGIALSALFFLINIMTLNWYPLPWVDEVLFSDTPINVVLTGKWFSTAWRYTYSPLHAFLLIPWIWCFGISHTAVTSLNIVIAFLLCILMLQSLINAKIIKSIWSLIIFLSMFWGASTISWIFRMGRPDVLAMLFSFLVVVEILNIIQFNKKKYIRLFLFSLLLFTSSISSLPFILFLLLVLFISQTQYRNILLQQAMTFATACLFGFFLISAFYWFHDCLLIYLARFITSSATITGENPFLTRIIDAYQINKEALTLSIVNIFVITLFIYKKRFAFKSINVIFLFSCLLIPLIMTLAGRFPVYYSWLFFLPTLVLTISLFDDAPYYIKILISLITTFIFISGLPYSLSKADKFNIARINHFISNQPITSNSIVISDYIPYYAIKNITNKCYFPVIVSTAFLVGKQDSTITAYRDYGKLNSLYKLVSRQIQLERKTIIVNKIDFIIITPNDHGTDRTEPLKNIMKKQQSLGKTIAAIDSLNNPKIIIYQVK